MTYMKEYLFLRSMGRKYKEPKKSGKKGFIQI